MLQILHTITSKVTIICIIKQIYGKPIHSECGIFQEDVLSPILFDIVVDAIIQEWEHQLPLLVADLLYYADDGGLAGYCVKDLQYGLDVLVDLFGKYCWPIALPQLRCGQTTRARARSREEGKVEST